jgi:hypothetical protein
MTRHFPHAFLVAETITNLEEHRQNFEGLWGHARESSIDARASAVIGPVRSPPSSSELGLRVAAWPAPITCVKDFA